MEWPPDVYSLRTHMGLERNQKGIGNRVLIEARTGAAASNGLRYRQYLLGVDQPKEKSIVNFFKNLSSRQCFYARRDIQYLCIVCPSTQSGYDLHESSDQLITSVYRNYFWDRHVLYPDLRLAAARRATFSSGQKNGLITSRFPICFQELLAFLQICDLPSTVTVLEEEANSELPNLANEVSERDDDTKNIHRKYCLTHFLNNTVEDSATYSPAEGIKKIRAWQNRSPGIKKSILIYGGSCAEIFSNFLSVFFERTVYVNASSHRQKHLCRSLRPDIAISLLDEECLDRTRRDRRKPSCSADASASSKKLPQIVSQSVSSNELSAGIKLRHAYLDRIARDHAVEMYRYPLAPSKDSLSEAYALLAEGDLEQQLLRSKELIHSLLYNLPIVVKGIKSNSALLLSLYAALPIRELSFSFVSRQWLYPQLCALADKISQCPEILASANYHETASLYKLLLANYSLKAAFMVDKQISAHSRDIDHNELSARQAYRTLSSSRYEDIDTAIERLRSRYSQSRLLFDLDILRKTTAHPCSANGGQSAHFNSLIKGRRVAIVGPVPSKDEIGSEIDSYDIVVRFSASSIHIDESHIYGTKTDLVYYSSHSRSNIIPTKNLITLSRDVKYLCFTMGKYVPEGILEVISNARVTESFDHFFYRGNPNLLQRCLLDILFCQPCVLKIYNCNLFASPSLYKPSYASSDVLNRAARNNLRRGMLSLTYINHDPINSFMFTKMLYMMKLIVPDSNLQDILAWTCEEYMTRLERYHGCYKPGVIPDKQGAGHRNPMGSQLILL
ncbi:MAG: hypothetical protein WBN80_04195 [Prochlorococcaceae cyanobacterium]